MPCGYPLDLYSGHLPHAAPTPSFLLAPALPSSALAGAPWNLGPAAGRNYRTSEIRPPRGSGSTASTPAQYVEPAGFQLCPHRIVTLHQAQTQALSDTSPGARPLATPPSPQRAGLQLQLPLYSTSSAGEGLARRKLCANCQARLTPR